MNELSPLPRTYEYNVLIQHNFVLLPCHIETIIIFSNTFYMYTIVTEKQNVHG